MGPAGRLTCVILIGGSAVLGWLCAGGTAFPDPRRLENAVRALEALDARTPPRAGGVVCVGSSSMRGWGDGARCGLSPSGVVNRGIDGSTMRDAAYYVDRLVLPHRPRAVVLYAGDNDLADGVSPGQLRDAFREFAAAVHAKLPETRIHVISIKPSPARWALWPKMSKANAMLREACAADPRLDYVAASERMLGRDGRPRAGLYGPDGLHMNPRGYAVWREAVRPRLFGGAGAAAGHLPLGAVPTP